MSATTIDKLQVEIQSNSRSATKGIDGFVASLEKLKTIGDFGAVCKNLQSLNNTLASFKSVKVGSVGTLINSLSKLDKVTESLSPEKIEAFASKVKILTDKIRPLSDQMTSLNQGFKNIGYSVSAVSNNIGVMNGNINTTTLNMSSMINVATAVVSAIKKIVNAIGDMVAEAMEWDGVSARFVRGFGNQAQEAYEWVEKLNDKMGINTQQFMQYSSIFATMLNGFGVATEDASKMAIGYTELAYDIWAGYNDIYKSSSDAIEAVKSAIAGEVEPIRRAGFTIIESTLEQTAANHGLEISLADATEAQKSYLRYLTLVDQAHAQNLVGTYAKELNTAEGLMRTFSQQVKSLAQAFGSLFLPVLTKVMPYLQAFVELLTVAVRKVASFFGIEIQEVDWSGYGSGISAATDATDALADANNGVAKTAKKAAKAAKELKNATIGIDELNIISPPTQQTGSAGGAGGSGSGVGGLGGGFDNLGVDSLWDESILDGIKSKVDELKEKFKEWWPVLAGIGTAIAGLSLAKFADSVETSRAGLKKFLGVAKTVGKVVAVAGISIAVGKIAWDFTGAYLDGTDKHGLLKTIGATLFGTALSGVIGGEAGAGFTMLVSGAVTLTRLVVELKEGSVKISDPKAIATAFVGGLETILGGALVIDALKGGTWIKGIKNAILNGLKKAIKKLSFGSVLKTFGSKIATALSGLGGIIASIPGWAVAVVAAAVGVLVAGIVDYDFTDIGYKFGEAVGKCFRKIADWWKPIGEAISDGINKAFAWLKENFTFENVLSFIGKLCDPVWWGSVAIPKMLEIGANLIKGLWDGFWGWFDNLMENIGEFISGFIKGFNDGFEIHSPSKVFERMGGFLIEGLWLGITGWFNKLITNVSTFVTDTIKKVKEFFGISGSTSSTFKTIGSNLVQGVIDGIKGMGNSLWNSLKDWANGVISSIKGFFGIHSPSTVARDQIGKMLVSGTVEGVKSGANALVQPFKNMWNNAKNWWNKSKGNLATYTPSIGNIKSKLSSAWTTARNWWNKSKGNMSFTPTIGSITSALKSAWNSAKKWWNDNVKLSIPSLSLKISYSQPTGAIKKAVVKALGLSGWPSLKFAANGGVFDQGSLVWAGERGPEIVANAAGGKTGVMNIEQMQTAVYEGVYAAMLATQGNSGGGTADVHVYLGGREIAASVEQRQKERGASIMGTQVYRYG